MGGLYEVTDGAVKKYYAIAGQIVAMDDGNGLKYFLTDHLGSVVAVLSASGTLISQQRYLPFGQVRTGIGPITQTDFGFTGQRNLDAQGNASLGLMDYHARFYDSYLNRFIQPDTIIPNLANPQSWNRYGYVLNDPINLVDPSGHFGKCRDKSGYRCEVTQDKVSKLELQWRAQQKRMQELQGLMRVMMLMMQAFSSTGGIGSVGSGGDDDYCSRHLIECGFGGSGSDGPGTSRMLSGYNPTAFILGFGGGSGAGVFNQAGAENLFMLQEDGYIHVQAFAYGGQGTGEGGSIAPYAGVVFNLKDFASYRGPFITYTLNIGWGEGIAVSYFQDAYIKPFEPGGVQGFTVSPVGVFGFSFSGTYTIYEEIEFPWP